MLPRPKRLTRADFGLVAAGKRAVSAHFSVTATRTSEGKAAAVVSKKIARLSVERHALKRKMLAIATPHVVAGHSFIIYARKGSTLLTYASLKKELEQLLSSLPTV
jgi:ribonuclease P protein component